MANTGTDIGALTEALNEKLDRDVQNPANLGKEEIAHLAMPSAVYIDLTLPASDGTVEAPADGYIIFSKAATASGQFIGLYTQLSLSADAVAVVPGDIRRVFIPVKKGATVHVAYSASGNTNFFRFCYANGTKHLAPQS